MGRRYTRQEMAVVGVAGRKGLKLKETLLWP